ncbi:MAG: hypothetical protein MZU84_08165 [Sphingobacterium sp.]|nr:hypothetical protein [Sphingobacterium sp.]
MPARMKMAGKKRPARRTRGRGGCCAGATGAAAKDGIEVRRRGRSPG